MDPALVYASPGFAQPVSSLSHLAGAGVFAVLTVVLVRRGWGSPVAVVSLAVFGLSTVFLLSMSGVYHLLPPSGGRDVLQRLDVAGVFGLVAGTFTPVHAILFRGHSRWVPLVLIWGAAVVGMTLRTVFPADVPPALGIGIFLALGWAGLLSGFSLWRRAGFLCIRPLLWGGLAYTAGAVVLVMDWLRPVPGVVEAHELWHLAVLTGISLHWMFVLRLVPQPPLRYRPGKRMAAAASEA